MKWPGPHTWLIEANHKCPSWLRKKNKVAVRVPDLNICQNLLNSIAMPITSTSANRTKQRPIKNYREACRQYKKSVHIIKGRIGKNKKPSQAQLEGLDIILFDIQDVGVRFYTYISTLHYIMEACAENEIPLIVLDRPNPNGHYVDGPVLKPEFKSFVGMHPVPVVYGMTIGEYARMINGEKWLDNGVQCDLSVIEIEGYDHETPYLLPIKPSPNLPNEKAVNLYPSLCFFEGTTVSCGRGTEQQFQIFGSPELPEAVFSYTFTPEPNFGAKYPKHQGKKCFGRNLQDTDRLDELNLEWLIEAYQNHKEKDSFFNDFFVKLAGTAALRQDIEDGLSPDSIRDRWQKDIIAFKSIREKYLLYD